MGPKPRGGKAAPGADGDGVSRRQPGTLARRVACDEEERTERLGGVRCVCTWWQQSVICFDANRKSPLFE